MKSKELKIYNIPRDGASLLVLTVKPRKQLIFVLSFSLTLIILSPEFYMLGLVLAAISLFAIVAMPDRTLVEAYYSMLVVYDSRQIDTCFCVYWEDILNWQYIKKPDHDKMRIELIDGQIVEFDCFKDKKLMMLMNNLAHGKEKKLIKKRGRN